MPFLTTDPPMERARLVALYQDGLYTATELADRFGVTRPTVYTWIARYRDGGAEALADRSSARLTQHARTPPELETLIVEARQAHPSWGPRKLLPDLARRYPGLRLPAPSTAGAILQRHGLTKKRRPRRVPKHPGRTPLVTRAPNEVWTADFKGQFKTTDGVYCYPLTVCDAHSRYVLSCRGLPSVKQTGARSLFERLFDEYGLPEAIRLTTGSPSPLGRPAASPGSRSGGSSAASGTTASSPGSRSRTARMNGCLGTLKAETARPPERDMGAQQKRFDAWRTEFNRERPHEALGYETPASVYAPSPRSMPETLPAPSYPGHYEVRRVSKCGTYKWKRHQLFISQALGHEWVGFEEVDDGVWWVYFYDRLLARLDERGFKLHG